MFRNLFRSISRGRRKDEANARGTWSPFTSSPEASRNRRYHDDEYEDDEEEEDGDEDEDDDQAYSPRRRDGGPSYFDRDPGGHNYEQEHGIDNEDDEDVPLLPIFSAVHLDGLPLYNTTHAIRLLIVQKCETTLSWDQLRSPQISQFLVKPIQNEVRLNHFNRATLCALIANCLQFQKEGHSNPGNVGVSRTRALISELLAMRLLKELSTWELIDALSYDFNPLQGMVTLNEPTFSGRIPSDEQLQRPNPRVTRVSTIEIAIRAEAKRFLAHPLVVQHLEAIWAGNIVFHSEQDNLHRKQRHNAPAKSREYGTNGKQNANALPASSKLQSTNSNLQQFDSHPSRRSVTLYDPKEASLFKLSRLRVPRYRQVFSTLSFATMLGLFVAVLVERSLYITPLEVLFWFWSIGYMLDEVVGFSEQGFGLYILSFWNAFDLGILLLFATYYCLRLYGIVLAESGKHHIASVAYDVLASTAILLFPRLFSVLDHYRYFSQLLIAFRMMAQDLVAILILIMISCSGFFVAFTLSFADENTDGNAVAYALFQLVMGFTPAAWDHWADYNILGKAIMAIFLIMCHFLIVTILITVLTNSFMAIVKNAEEEHQFLFAVNTISMVKSDALFSYIAPTNIIGWLLSPLRYIMPMRQFVKINRTIIKVTHAPILFAIFTYERIIMARTAYVPIDLIEQMPIKQKQPIAFSINKPPEMFSPGPRMREASVINFRKDQALDEVFRRPFRGDTMRTTTQNMDGDRRNSKNVVDTWMQAAENEGGASPPMEQPRSVLERLEHRRPTWKRATTADRLKMAMKPSREFSAETRSAVSDPDLLSVHAVRKRPQIIAEEYEEPDHSTETLPQETDADGDDETNDESDAPTPALGESAISIRENRTPADDSESEYFQTPTAGKSPMAQLSHAAKARLRDSPDALTPASPYQGPSKAIQKRAQHQRNASSATILFAPPAQTAYDSTSSSKQARPARPLLSRPPTGTNTGTATPTPGGASRPAKPKQIPAAIRPRPIMPPRQKTAPGPTNLGGLSFLHNQQQSRRNIREPSFNARALDLASEIGDNKVTGATDGGGISGFPASFSEQFMRERELQRRAEEDRRRSEDEEKGMVNRIMLARMHTLEEGFREVLREIKDLSSQHAGSGPAGSRRDSEIESAGVSASAIGRRSGLGKVDNGAGAGSSSGMPKVPIGRIGGVGGKSSPRKVPRRGSKKEKESERRSFGRAVGEASTSAPLGESPLSVIERPAEEQKQEEEQLAKSLARPTTAIRRDEDVASPPPGRRASSE